MRRHQPPIKRKGRERSLRQAPPNLTPIGDACPTVVVKYTATEGGGTHPLELPDPIVAYLTMSDVEPGTLIQP